MNADELGQRVIKVETRIDNHEQRLQKQEANNDIIVELRTIMKSQTEINKEQNKQMSKFGEVLANVNDNLTNLNISQNQLKDDMSKIGSRVSHIEQSQDDKKIDLSKLIKDVVFKVIPSLILAYLLLKFGLN